MGFSVVVETINLRVRPMDLLQGMFKFYFCPVWPCDDYRLQGDVRRARRSSKR